MKKSTRESSKKQDEQPVDRGGGAFSSLTGFLESMGKLAGAAEQRSQRQGAAKESGATAGKSTSEQRVGGILNGLAELAEKLNEIAAKGESKSTQGEFTIPSKEGGIKGVYGFSVKMGLPYLARSLIRMPWRLNGWEQTIPSSFSFSIISM